MIHAAHTSPVQIGDARLSSKSIWVLCGPKAGDNAQMLALAAATGEFAVRRLQFRGTELLTNLLLRVTLAGIDPARSDALAPPWPDLVITAGRRNEPVARWLRRANGGRTRLVHVGRPWTHPSQFDLVVTTPQYFVPPAPNVLTLPLPLHGLTAQRLADAAAVWAPKLAGLPRPWTAVLVGGDSGPYRLTPGRAARLGNELRASFSAGSLLITTSARTPRASVDALRTAVSGLPQHVFDWHRDARAENPYLGYLALADAFVVTAESASMLAEASSTGRPLWMFDLAGPPGEALGWLRWKPLTFALAQHLAPRRLRREVGRLHAHLVESGAAAWLGGARVPARDGGRDGAALAAAGLGEAVARVRGLLGSLG